jgi:glycosyltransferase involved in cell wall biosynthesis
MRVHIFDPQLNLVDGHYAAYDAAVAAELRRRGIETRIYGTSRQRCSIPSQLEAEPVFSRGMFEEVGTDPLTWALENFVQLGYEFHSDLTKLGSERFNGGDLAFFPNIIQYQINGVRDWILDLPPERRPAVVLKPSYLTYAMPYLQRRPNKEMIPLLYRFSMRQLAGAHPRTWICSDTEEMVKQFATLSELPIHLLPLPLIMERRPMEPKDHSRIDVVYLGHASMLKGFHLLADVVRRVVAAKNGPHFVIQSHGEAALCDALQEALSDVPPDEVTVIRGTIDADAYGRLLHMADIVLLPYAREFYGWASSGIFSEAMSLGKVTVVTEGTWAAQQLDKFRGGGVTFKRLDADSVAEAVRGAVRALPQLNERAAQAASAWRQHHCAASFADKLLAMVS